MDRIFAKLKWVLAIASGGILVALALLVFFNVATRFLFNKPYGAVLELTENFLAVAVFFGLAYTHAKGRHISLDFLNRYLRQGATRVLDIFNSVFTLIISSLIVWQGVLLALQMKQRNIPIGYHLTSTPIYPFMLFVSLGFLVFALEAAVQLVKLWRGKPSTDSVTK